MNGKKFIYQAVRLRVVSPFMICLISGGAIVSRSYTRESETGAEVNGIWSE